MTGDFLLDETHDSRVRSWLESANRIGGDFPVQNLPFAVFRRRDSGEQFRGGVAIGDRIVDLAALAALEPFEDDAARGILCGAQSSLNSLMRLGPRVSGAVRRALFAALREGSPGQVLLQDCLVPQDCAEYHLPAQIGDYTDFYTSIYHATTVGRMMRPDHPLLPNYQWVPIGYHGRASSITVSDHDVRRPSGQRLPAGAATPVVEPTRRLDYELELGVFIGEGNPSGSPISMPFAEAHIFGLCLLNDWSARDVQAWEAQPLGPFLAKNFATTISPWIVTLEALAPFRVPLERPQAAPAPMPYLDSSLNRRAGAIDIRLEALIETQSMIARGAPPHRLSSTSFRHAFWTIGQLVAHHTVNGCNLRAGDLLGTGTQSGPGPGEAGSLLELSAGGHQQIQVGRDESRTFLEDGDTVTLRGWCEKPGAVRIGFGTARGRVTPA